MGLIKQKGSVKISKTLKNILFPYKDENSWDLEKIEDKIAKKLYSAFEYDGLVPDPNAGPMGNWIMSNPRPILKKLGKTCRCKEQCFSDIYLESLGTYTLAYKHYLQEDVEDEKTLWDLLDEITKIVRTYTKLPVIVGIWTRDHELPGIDDIYILLNNDIIPYNEFNDDYKVKKELIEKINYL